MQDFTTFATFALTSLLIEITPGPNMAYLALIAVTEGRKSGYAAVAGVAVGLSVVGLATALGLTVLIGASSFAYQALRWAGVAYLLWLAWDGWRGASEASEHAKVGSTLRQFFQRGMITNLLNPKAAVFFVAVLPGFLTPAAGIKEVLTLTVIYVVVATSVHAIIVTAAGAARRWLSAADGRETAVRRMLSISLVAVAGWVIWKT
jgi:threonine/homoserine/homoserine lactone efflux protein